MEEFSWPRKLFSRQFIGLIIASILVGIGKELNWIYFAIYFCYIVGNQLDSYKDLVKTWLEKKG